MPGVDPRREHLTLRDAWDRAAEQWVRWSRSPKLDHAFWRLNLPSLVSLLPAPGRLTLDVACGEGRVAWALKERGHRVVGIEGSPALARAAREADPAFEVHVADATAMPLADGVADLAILSMALMNMDDMPAVIAEAARVLRARGVLCLSVVHPLESWGHADGAGYFETVRYTADGERGGVRMAFHDTHRPLSDYFAALAAAGFLVERLLEPVPDDAYAADWPEVVRWRSRPAFLHVRAVAAGA